MRNAKTTAVSDSTLPRTLSHRPTRPLIKRPLNNLHDHTENTYNPPSETDDHK
jgi:hypothetical protein